MLQNMRSASKTWIVRAFFAILVFAFAILWGVGDVFKPGQMTDHSVVTVGNEKISLQYFQKETALASQHLQQQNNQPIDKKFLQQRVLRNLISNALLDQEADLLGLAISDKQLVELVTNAPGFKDKNGQFSRQIFEAVARAEHQTVKTFEEELRRQIRRSQLTELIATTVPLPKAYIIPLYKWQYEKRTIDWANVKPDSFTKIPAPKPEELQAYYEAHKDEFTLPEERDVTVAILTEASVRAKIKLTDEETQAGFAARRGDAKSALPTKEESNKIINELKAEKSMEEFNRLSTSIEDSLSGGMGLEELAKTFDLKLAKIEGLRRDGSNRNKPDLSPEVLVETIDQSFKMTMGEVPFLSQLGSGEYLAARVDKIHDSRLQAFDEVSANVTKLVSKENQQKAAREMATSIIEKVNAGGDLAQLAKENKLELKTGVNIERMDTKDQQPQVVPTGMRSVAFITDLNKAALTPGADGSFAVVIPRKITELKPEEIKEDELKTFAKALEKNMAQDMYQQYMSSLERRYKVVPNNAVLESLSKQAN